MLHFLDLGIDRSIDIVNINRSGAKAAFVRSDTGTAILRIHANVTWPGVVTQKPVRVGAGDDRFVCGRHLSGVLAKTSAPQPGKPAMTKTDMLSGMGKIDVRA